MQTPTQGLDLPVEIRQRSLRGCVEEVLDGFGITDVNPALLAIDMGNEGLRADATRRPKVHAGVRSITEAGDQIHADYRRAVNG